MPRPPQRHLPFAALLAPIVAALAALAAVAVLAAAWANAERNTLALTLEQGEVLLAALAALAEPELPPEVLSRRLDRLAAKAGGVGFALDGEARLLAHPGIAAGRIAAGAPAARNDAILAAALDPERVLKRVSRSMLEGRLVAVRGGHYVVALRPHAERPDWRLGVYLLRPTGLALLAPLGRLGWALLAVTAALALLAWALARRLLAPLGEIAAAAEAMVGPAPARAPGVTIRGPAELRRAGAAINRLREAMRRSDRAPGDGPGTAAMPPSAGRNAALHSPSMRAVLDSGEGDREGGRGMTAATASMYEPALETMPREALRALQLERLRQVLRHAEREMPFYRDAFAAAGLAAAEVESLEQLRRLPFTAKDDLRRHYPFGFFARPMAEIQRIHASSGTSGRPTVVGYSARDLDNWAGLMARSLAAAGVRAGDIVHNAYGYGLFTGGLGAHDGAARLGCAVVPVSGGNTERQVRLLQDFGARVLCATPSYALNIAEVAERMGVDLAAGPLAVGIFGAEPWSEALRAELQRRLGLRAVDVYGLSEVMGPGVAVECAEAQAGQHLWEDHFLAEIVNPESGEPVPEGTLGELVLTTLTKEAMPLIRYRTRDITRLLEEPCICGRSHRRLGRVAGRSDDMLIVRGVNLYPSEIEAQLVGFPDIAPHYQLVVTREGALDGLAVEVEAAVGVGEGDYPGIAAAVRRHLKSTTGLTCAVAVKPPGAVPRSEGKAVRVRDERPK